MTQQKQFTIMRIISIVLFVLSIIIGTMYQNNKILSIQRFSGILITYTISMTAMLLLLISFFGTDIGFFKFVIILGLIATTLSIVLTTIHNRTRYQLLESDDYNIILQYTIKTENTKFYFYRQENAFVYYLFDESPNPTTYDSTITIEGSQIVIEKCNENLCFFEYIDLE